MVDGRHLENSFFAELVGANLQNHRERFDDENAADEGQQKLLLDHDCDGADRATERERAYVAHENFGRMRVVPEKSYGGADHGSAEDSELTDLRHALQFEIGRKRGVAAEVGEDGERSGGDHGATDGETVEAVGKIHGVAGPDNHDDNEDHEGQKGEGPQMRIRRPSLHYQVGPKLLKEWNQQAGGVLSAILQGDERDGNHYAGRDLVTELGARGEAEIAAMDDLQVIVGETDGREGERGEHGDPDKRIAQIGPEQGRHQNCDRDQQATHGGSAGFFLVCLRSLFADVLANLKIAQSLNYDGTYDQSGKKGGEAGERSAERQITKDAEGREVVKELQV